MTKHVNIGQRFLVVPNRALYDSRLKQVDLRLLMCLCDYENKAEDGAGDGVFSKTQEAIAGELGSSRSTINGAIRRLRDTGYLEVREQHQQMANGSWRQTSNAMRVLYDQALPEGAIRAPTLGDAPVDFHVVTPSPANQSDAVGHDVPVSYFPVSQKHDTGKTMNPVPATPIKRPVSQKRDSGKIKDLPEFPVSKRDTITDSESDYRERERSDFLIDLFYRLHIQNGHDKNNRAIRLVLSRQIQQWRSEGLDDALIAGIIEAGFERATSDVTDLSCFLKLASLSLRQIAMPRLLSTEIQDQAPLGHCVEPVVPSVPVASISAPNDARVGTESDWTVAQAMVMVWNRHGTVPAGTSPAVMASGLVSMQPFETMPEWLQQRCLADLPKIFRGACGQSLETWEAIVRQAAASDFLCRRVKGKSGTFIQPVSLTYFFQEKNLNGLLDLKYDNMPARTEPKARSGKRSIPDDRGAEQLSLNVAGSQPLAQSVPTLLETDVTKKLPKLTELLKDNMHNKCNKIKEIPLETLNECLNEIKQANDCVTHGPLCRNLVLSLFNSFRTKSIDRTEDLFQCLSAGFQNLPIDIAYATLHKIPNEHRFLPTRLEIITVAEGFVRQRLLYQTLLNRQIRLRGAVYDASSGGCEAIRRSA